MDGRTETDRQTERQREQTVVQMRKEQKLNKYKIS